MGKKNKMRDNEVPSNNVVQLEPDDVNVNSETHSQTKNSTDSVKKSKKKNRKRELNGTIIEDSSVLNKSEESNTLLNPTPKKIKKEKKKKHAELNEEELCEKVQNYTDTNILNKDQLDVSKKKKKKSKLLNEDKHTIETCVEIEDQKPQKDSKGKKNKNSSLNEPNFVKEAPTKQNDTNQKQKKAKKKAKTGAPVLNNEESQVTEEDIDRFIDELDDEDNKQYEDWVKLLDARLSKKQQTE